jgi:ATP-dependent Clp protease ATP-binding subunit ClpA
MGSSIRPPAGCVHKVERIWVEGERTRGACVFERFTDRARRVVVLAQEEARLLNHNYIGTEHILLGLIHEGEGVAAKSLESLGISLEAVRAQVEEIIGHGGQHRRATSRSRRAPRRSSSSACAKHSSSDTTTSAPSTSSWG